jgi:hypothetical protein
VELKKKGVGVGLEKTVDELAGKVVVVLGAKRNCHIRRSNKPPVNLQLLVL